MSKSNNIELDRISGPFGGAPNQYQIRLTRLPHDCKGVIIVITCHAPLLVVVICLLSKLRLAQAQYNHVIRAGV